ncbi:MAG TPA: hypothetical protein VIJ62_00455, partial [Rhizomicrobium sp.]
MFKYISIMLAASACAFLLATGAFASNFDVPAGDLRMALRAYMSQAGVQLMFSDDALGDARSKGVKGSLSADEALAR